MKNEGSDRKREFLITGARTYVDVDDAMMEFRRLVQDQCRKVVSVRLDEVSRACGIDWKPNEIRNYIERTAYYFNFGKQLAVEKLGGLYFCLRLPREHDRGSFRASVFLYRQNQNLASELWGRLNSTSDNSYSGPNNLFFERRISGDNIPDFGEYLDQAITDFNAFINVTGGLKEYQVKGHS
jgi:hypothetical protein